MKKHGKGTSCIWADCVQSLLQDVINLYSEQDAFVETG